MLRTLFHIPREISGVPLFGPGILLALWLAFGAVLLWRLVRKQGWNADTLGYLPLLAIGAAVIGLVLPAIIEPSGLAIRGYGVMLLAGIVAGLATAAWLGRRIGIEPEVILSLAFWMFAAGIVGARGLYILRYRDEFQGETLGQTLGKVVNITQGGLVVYGSLIGAMLALILFSRRNKLPALVLCDLIAPSMAFGLALGRIGCLFNGCCHGDVCELPWGAAFPRQSPPYERQVERGLLVGIEVTGAPSGEAVVKWIEPSSPAAKSGLKTGNRLTRIDGKRIATAGEAQQALADRPPRLPIAVEVAGGETRSWTPDAEPARSRPVQPTQIYSAIGAGLLGLFLLAFFPYRRRDGEVLAMGFTLYSVIRYLEEIIRSDEPGAIAGLTISQAISLALLIVAAGMWVWLLRRPVTRSIAPVA